MKISSVSLFALSPLDGRYQKQTNILRPIFSEFALIKFRLKIEIYWLKKLSSCNEITELLPFNHYIEKSLNNIIYNFNIKDAKRIKSIEKTIKHDVKAIEYFLIEKIRVRDISKISNIISFIHFGCTSEDINNLSYALMLKKARQEVILPTWSKIINLIKNLAIKYKKIPILSRTHGQPATPSTIGKEMANFSYRLIRQYHQLKLVKILGKMNGTVGNYNAHRIAYPNINWILLSKEFVKSLGIHWNPYTTQIEPHDYMAEFFDCINRFNTILIDFNRDMWGYIARGIFTPCTISSEIGSSIMPHKVNPIDFEHSEGNLGLANVIMKHFSAKLPISRWQRDLTDSTVLRNVGLAIGYSLIAYFALLNGIEKLIINKNYVLKELNQNWQILTEPIQMVMRRYGINNAYEKLKKFSRGKYLNAVDIHEFIDLLPLPEKEKIRLKEMLPCSYIGYAIQLVDELKVLEKMSL
ncbi:adenylosuccinate lyase [Candidatus Schneideria nysicola]|uniref:adenylosuccinate lyase n=1 Tax=Candidatus Schneideria nysicola TaxID=1081631 RepID=UPI001CAA7BFF|nr:adenylosuccinate lyase [Candidatus Schneideria nysicola]UAJ65717.1 adenylosuccinate lyase [Candidatus Schneideria nysicola]